MTKWALFAAAGLILTFTGAGLVGIWLSPLEIAQAPAPYLAVMSLWLAVLLSIFRAWHWVLVMVLCLAWQLALWLPHSGRGPLPVPTNVGRVVVLPISNLRAIDYVRNRMPELVIVSDRSDGGHDRLGDLAALYPLGIGLDEGSGLAILAREGIPLEPIHAMQSGAPVLLARAVIDGRTLIVGAVHLARPFPLGEYDQQRVEVRTVLEALGKPGDPVILAGDFNAAPWMSTMDLFRRSGIFSWDIGPGTWPSGAPDFLRIPLDQALVGDGQLLAEVLVGPDLGSAHLPFEIDLGVPSVITTGGP